MHVLKIIKYLMIIELIFNEKLIEILTKIEFTNLRSS